MIDQLVNAKVLKNRTFIISDSLNQAQPRRRQDRHPRESRGP